MMTGLESAKLKIVRATEHLSGINRLVADITSRTDSYEIIKDANGKETINFLVDPPPDITILAGEIVYQLRSAIDHLAFDLVKLNLGPIALPTDWDKRCNFPLWFTIPNEQIKCGHTNPPLPYNCFTKTLPGISKTAFAFIESVQPYHSGAGTHNVIRLIAQLSNVDKHRHLNVTLPRAAVRQCVKSANGMESLSVAGGLKQGAEIQYPIIAPDEAVDVKRSLSTYVTFDEPTVGTGPDTLEVQHILQVCLEQIETVLPAFTQLLKNPD
jgi:hypothetical protein